MIHLQIEVWICSLCRKDGTIVDSSHFEKHNDSFAYKCFYDFGFPKKDGDYLKWEKTTAVIDEDHYIEDGMTNKVLDRLQPEE